MRARTILVAALMAGVSAACSKPAPQSSGAASPTDDREIRLVDSPLADSAVVSALEAGRAVILNQTARTSTRPGTAIPAFDPDPDTEVPSLAVTEMAAPAALVPATTSLPLRIAGTGAPAATREAGSGTSAGSTPATLAGGTRGPVILIRGGMGTPHDDCKLHPVASRAAGIAINNVAPPIPGRVAVNNRLPGGNGGFTRIR